MSEPCPVEDATASAGSPAASTPPPAGPLPVSTSPDPTSPIALSPATEVFLALQRIHRASEGLEWEYARRSEMRLIEHIALRYVMGASGPVGPGELSSRVGMSTGSGTELVDRLVRSGHLERHPHPRDGRRIVLRVTAVAEARVQLERASLHAAIGQLTDSLTEGEALTVADYLARAVDLVVAHAVTTGRCSSGTAPSDTGLSDPGPSDATATPTLA